jgi:hypothetical protein
MLAGSVGGPCRVSSRPSSLGLKGRLEFACLPSVDPLLWTSDGDVTTL